MNNDRPSYMLAGEETNSENKAAKRALKISNKLQCHCCVVCTDTGEILQIIKYFRQSEMFTEH